MSIKIVLEFVLNELISNSDTNFRIWIASTYMPLVTKSIYEFPCENIRIYSGLLTESDTLT